MMQSTSLLVFRPFLDLIPAFSVFLERSRSEDISLGIGHGNRVF
jgi:hypothetical protein